VGRAYWHLQADLATRSNESRDLDPDRRILAQPAARSRRRHATWRDAFADGINLTSGTTQTTALHVYTRNTGDDGFAMWSKGTANERCAIRFDAASLPMLANGR
jgi:hypothetical protein